MRIGSIVAHRKPRRVLVLDGDSRTRTMIWNGAEQNGWDGTKLERPTDHAEKREQNSVERETGVMKGTL